eukprot:260150_1
MSSPSNDELRKQIKGLKTIIRNKNVQLNMVIKQSEEKCQDIHKSYRDLANELHNSWKCKHETLQRENDRLMNEVNVLIKQHQLHHTQKLNCVTLSMPESQIAKIVMTSIRGTHESYESYHSNRTDEDLTNAAQEGNTSHTQCDKEQKELFMVLYECIGQYLLPFRT